LTVGEHENTTPNHIVYFISAESSRRVQKRTGDRIRDGGRDAMAGARLASSGLRESQSRCAVWYIIVFDSDATTITSRPRARSANRRKRRRSKQTPSVYTRRGTAVVSTRRRFRLTEVSGKKFDFLQFKRSDDDNKPNEKYGKRHDDERNKRDQVQIIGTPIRQTIAKTNNE